MKNVKAIIIDDCFYTKKVYGQTFIETLSGDLGDVVILKSQEEIKKLNISEDNILVIYSSYPLFKTEDMLYVIDYSINKNLSICNFNGGFFVKKAYFFEKNANFTSSELYFNYNFKIENNLTLNNAKEVLRQRIIEKHINNGVIFDNINSVIVDYLVKIEPGVKIGNNCEIYGKTTIGNNCEILNGCYLENAIIHNGVKIVSSNLTDCEIFDNVSVGPMARIRPKTEIQCNCRIGNFVEIKNSKICENTKIAHLTYVGDAYIGKNCNLGCGVVFCNFDGKNKHKTIIGDNCFIGSNVNLVAPIKIKDNCFIASGTTVTKNLDKNMFAIERAELREKVNTFKL